MARPPTTGDEGADRSPALSTRLLAEGLGTFALTFIAGAGDAAARLTGGEVDAAARAVAPGLLVLAFIYALGDRSGAHFNPAVTIAFTARRLFPPVLVAPYVAAQLAGAAAAALVLRALFGSASEAAVNAPRAIGPLAAVGVEIVLAWLLVTVILGTADRYRVVGTDAAIAVGVTIALCGLVALPVEGASMNPARSTGPAIVAGRLGDLWIYWLGPLTGAMLAVAAARVLHGPAPVDAMQVEAATGARPHPRGPEAERRSPRR